MTYQKERYTDCVYARGKEEVDCRLVNELKVDAEGAGEVLLREFAARCSNVSHPSINPVLSSLPLFSSPSRP